MATSTRRFVQGKYTPVNPHKYKGNLDKIRYMSSYELETHRFFDNNANVISWSSEEIAIPYVSPVDNKVHKYYPDYLVEFINSSGEVIKQLIEVKPHAQTKAPHGNRKHAAYEQVTYAVNVAKWMAAQAWCQTHGIEFKIITERAIFS